MGDYKEHPFVTYLVGWPDALIIKAGVTNYQRWRKFCLRGAVVELLHMQGDGARDWCDLEANLGRELARRLPAAFAVKEDARLYLGSGGGGYMECHRAPSHAAYLDALASCAGIMLAHPNGHTGKSLRALMHGRTHGRTYEEPPSHRDYLQVVNACDSDGEIR